MIKLVGKIHCRKRQVYREDLFKAQEGKCYWCGRKLKLYHSNGWSGSMRAKFIMEIDHIIPRCAGGSNHFFNLVGACRGCNNRRSLLYLKFHKVLVVLGQESPAELLARYHSQNTTKQNNGGYDVP